MADANVMDVFVLQSMSGILLQPTLADIPLPVFQYHQLMQKRSDISKPQDSFIIVFNKDKQAVIPDLTISPPLCKFLNVFNIKTPVLVFHTKVHGLWH